MTRKPAVERVQQFVGIDLFIGWDQSDRDPDVIGYALSELAKDDFKLVVITNRGVKVYPGGMPETFCTDH